jgi:hypothetical protein
MKLTQGWPWFLAWAVVGAAGMTALLTPFTIGPFVAVAVVAAVIALARTKRSYSGLPGLVAGAGVLPLFVAWLNRSGPGEICSPGECTEEWSPWPWLAAGLLLVAAGTTIWVVIRRTR